MRIELSIILINYMHKKNEFINSVPKNMKVFITELNVLWFRKVNYCCCIPKTDRYIIEYQIL